MIMSITAFWEPPGVAEQHPVMGWRVVRFAALLARLRDEFDLIVDRVPPESCAESLGGIEMRQEKSHKLLSERAISCY